MAGMDVMARGQSKAESLVESSINIASGFFVSLLLWVYLVAPLYDVQVTMTQNLGITGIFTISAVIRSYFWRRFFNNGVHRMVVKWLRPTSEA